VYAAEKKREADAAAAAKENTIRQGNEDVAN
jgi:hypothetical protein